MIWARQVDDYSQIKGMKSNNLLISHFSFKEGVPSLTILQSKYINNHQEVLYHKIVLLQKNYNICIITTGVKNGFSK